MPFTDLFRSVSLTEWLHNEGEGVLMHVLRAIYDKVEGNMEKEKVRH